MEIPQEYLDMVGTRQELGGGLFSRRTNLEPQEYLVLNIRIGYATIVNIKEILATGQSSYEHPTFELLVKNDSMPRARWTRCFPIREINLKQQKA